jgi:hypothetical protein
MFMNVSSKPTLEALAARDNALIHYALARRALMPTRPDSLGWTA